MGGNTNHLSVPFCPPFDVLDDNVIMVNVTLSSEGIGINAWNAISTPYYTGTNETKETFFKRVFFLMCVYGNEGNEVCLW